MNKPAIHSEEVKDLQEARQRVVTNKARIANLAKMFALKIRNQTQPTTGTKRR